MGCQCHARPPYPGSPLHRRLCGPRGQSGRVRKISPPPEFESPTVQPVAGRYSEYGIAALLLNIEVQLCRVKETCKYIYYLSPENYNFVIRG